MESWNWRVQGLVWRVSVQFSWEVPESFVDNFGMHVIRVLGGVVDVFGLPSLATRSGFRFLVSLAVLGCGPCRGAVGRVGFRPSQMRSHCVSLALDMGDISRSPGPHIPLPLHLGLLLPLPLLLGLLLKFPLRLPLPLFLGTSSTFWTSSSSWTFPSSWAVSLWTSFSSRPCAFKIQLLFLLDFYFDFFFFMDFFFLDFFSFLDIFFLAVGTPNKSNRQLARRAFLIPLPQCGSKKCYFTRPRRKRSPKRKSPRRRSPKKKWKTKWKFKKKSKK